ncbi:hypothetical protein HGM15179_016557 [Zosterops borbonicus]|uniref:Uncharacterized protein n=1 Tax=Zosterops borbonicus TaxID=364589 RepID=A0A8K1LE67_9PASS|nr:hypothetical protein HGM15179_016557 [Zosterops borbonicus]
MSMETASSWKSVPRIPQTWKTWWLCPVMENTENSMEIPWKTPRVPWKSMEIPWKVHGKLQEFHGNSIEIPCKVHGNSMENSKNSIEIPWKFHGKLQEFHGNFM